jgi:flagellar motility protein MotE (MotC chaperone)
MSYETARTNYQAKKKEINEAIRQKRVYYNDKLTKLRERILLKANTKVVAKPTKDEFKQLIEESKKVKDVGFYEGRSGIKTFSQNWV